jgi:hypothetical protein
MRDWLALRDCHNHKPIRIGLSEWKLRHIERDQTAGLRRSNYSQIPAMQRTIEIDSGSSVNNANWLEPYDCSRHVDHLSPLTNDSWGLESPRQRSGPETSSPLSMALIMRPSRVLIGQGNASSFWCPTDMPTLSVCILMCSINDYACDEGQTFNVIGASSSVMICILRS